MKESIMAETRPSTTKKTGPEEVSGPVATPGVEVSAPTPETNLQASPTVVDASPTPDSAGFAGRTGFDADGSPEPELKGRALLIAAQEKAPGLTEEFIAAYDLDDDALRQIAAGFVPPPPVIGPIHSADLHLTPGGWVQTPPGVSLEQYAEFQKARLR
jgi:hypothetical protein